MTLGGCGVSVVIGCRRYFLLQMLDDWEFVIPCDVVVLGEVVTLLDLQEALACLWALPTPSIGVDCCGRPPTLQLKSVPLSLFGSPSA